MITLKSVLFKTFNYPFLKEHRKDSMFETPVIKESMFFYSEVTQFMINTFA